eukprot:SAG22_NODE_14194_length_382_cov_0.780919_2_plen_66_part_01
MKEKMIMQVFEAEPAKQQQPGTAVPAAPNRSINGGAKITDVDAMVRAGFVRKVYGILCVQMLVTSA